VSGQFERGGPGIEHDPFAVPDLRGGDRADRLFGLLIFLDAVQKLELEADSVGYRRAAVGAQHFSLIRQGLEIAADRHSADLEPFGQVLDRAFALLGDQLANLLLPGRLAH
jgi:hypothetical protein